MKASGSVLDLFGISLPIVQAPMAGAQDEALAIAVAEAGGLGSIPCAMLSPEGIRKRTEAFRARTASPVHLNFFAHRTPQRDPAREAAFRKMLAPYFAELGVDPNAPVGPGRAAFSDETCAVVEEVRPEIVSFQFGLPARELLDRVRKTGAKVVGCATTVAEARWLAAGGCDAIVAQGAEAGGHRGMFLSLDVATQVGTFALVPQVVDAVDVPVVAAGGIADARGMVAAFALGAAASQIGTAYLRCPEARIGAVHHRVLAEIRDDATCITNVFSGRPARGVANRFVRDLGPLSDAVPPFPDAGPIVALLRAKAEERGASDILQLWAGQAAPLARDVGAKELTLSLAREAAELAKSMAGRWPERR